MWLHEFSFFLKVRLDIWTYFVYVWKINPQISLFTLCSEKKVFFKSESKLHGFVVDLSPFPSFKNEVNVNVLRSKQKKKKKKRDAQTVPSPATSSNSSGETVKHFQAS